MTTLLLVAAVVCSVAQPNLPPPVLVARFAFDADTSDSVGDTDGEGDQVSFADASDCKIGQCARFADGALVQLPSRFDLPVKGGGFMAWVFVEQVESGVNSRVVSKASGSGFSNTHFQIALEDAGAGVFNWRLRVMTNSATEPVVQRVYVQPNAKPVLKQWQHIAASVSKDAIKFYVNGAVIFNAVVQLGGSGAYVPNSDVPFVLGNNRVGDDEFFRGKIDDARFYGVEVDGQDFSQTFVAAVFNDVPPPTPAPPPRSLTTTAATTAAATTANTTTQQMSGAPSVVASPSATDGLTIAVAVSAVILVLLVIVLVTLVLRARRTRPAVAAVPVPTANAGNVIAHQYSSVPRSPSQKAVLYDHVPPAETTYITLPS